MNISAYDPGDKAEPGSLYFEDDHRGIPLSEVGPIAWSEGIRIADFIYLGRSMEKDD
ncbi:hypothetical protein [uncultured Corynebacterium sp.]|uniref:hypothetical protein n=1 Tax=uncultured Corynebacterium sp. TaxID=159447 RepID=UPI0025CFBA9D|nr:hypothetical protein [uncultured Corynebacterium sp.]